nr:MAG TPA: hypothetical protein [Caudoviricetes sp.]
MIAEPRELFIAVPVALVTVSKFSKIAARFWV